MWIYNFTIVIHTKKETKELTQKEQNRNVFNLHWLESDSGKGSNEIVSALAYFFENIIMKCVSVCRYKKIQLFSDSCLGQNKNTTMLMFLLQIMDNSQIKRCIGSIEYYFPIKGHSYLPSDRIFGRIEKCYVQKQWSRVLQNIRLYMRNTGRYLFMITTGMYTTINS